MHTLNKSAVIGTSLKSWKDCPECGETYEGTIVIITPSRKVVRGYWETTLTQIARLQPCGHEVGVKL